MRFHLEHLDSIGDDGRNRTCDPQFRKPWAVIKIYSFLTLQTRMGIGVYVKYTHNTTCLRFKQIYLVLLMFTRLNGEIMGEYQGQVAFVIRSFSFLYIAILPHNFNQSIEATHV